jgi:cytochrome c peroxidase
MKVVVRIAVAAILAAGAAHVIAAETNQTIELAPPLGLPSVPVPADNVLTRAKIELGRKLFMDRRLSPNHTMSCAMCHVPEQGFASNELGGAVGIEGRSVRRNSPTLYNVAYFERLFHDGREISLENQIWGPLLARNEMGNPSVGYVIERIRSLPDYRGLFEAAFGGRSPGIETIGAAIASYERTLYSGRSRFDRWRYGGEPNALTKEEQEGFALFAGKARCATCHAVGANAALFTDQRFHNTGIGWERTVAKPRKYKVQLAPGVFTELDEAAIASVSEPVQNDVGRYEVTLNPDDRWAYKTPSLRNVALTGPYMHDGSIQTLAQVVDFYDKGGIENPVKDPQLQPLGLTPQEKQALVAFLLSLTGDNVDALVSDARKAPPSLPARATPPPRSGEPPPTAYR